MLKRTLRYLWGKKFLVLILLLLVLLVPNTLTRNLQVKDTTIITTMTIDDRQPTIKITAQKFKSTPGSTALEYDTATFTGTDIKAMLKDVSLAHCTEIKFIAEPNLKILQAIYNYQDLRANTKVNGTQTIDDLLKSQYYCCPQSLAPTN